jgi:hypothetical protein
MSVFDSQVVDMNFTDELTNENTTLEKLSSLICSLSVIILLMDLLMAKTRYLFLPYLFHRYFHQWI